MYKQACGCGIKRLKKGRKANPYGLFVLIKCQCNEAINARYSDSAVTE